MGIIAEIDYQGELFEMKVLVGGGNRPPECKRGKVVGFSRKSRKRMIEGMLRIQNGYVRATFITLTHSLIVSDEQAKSNLSKFLKRLERRFKNISGVWKKEIQKKGRIHFHLMVFNLPFVPQWQLQRVWERCTGEPMSIVDIRLASGKRRVMAYISKYIAKVSEDFDLTSLEDDPKVAAPQTIALGRYWAWFGRKKLPLAPRIRLRLIFSADYRYLRDLAVELSRGRASKDYRKVTLYGSACKRLYEAALGVGALDEETLVEGRIPGWQFDRLPYRLQGHFLGHDHWYCSPANPYEIDKGERSEVYEPLPSEVVCRPYLHLIMPE